LLAVYTGTNVANLNLIASNDDATNLVQSRLTFIATAGIEYRIAVDGFRNTSGTVEQGSVILNWAEPGGTRPVLSAARLLSTGEFEATFTGAVGRTFQIDYSPDLSTWIKLTNLVNVTGTTRFNDPDAAVPSRRFYRAVLLP